MHAAKVEQVKFDTTQLHARPELAAEQRMVDDASGEIEVRDLFLLTDDAVTSVSKRLCLFTCSSFTELWRCAHLSSPRKHGFSQSNLLANHN